MKDFEPFPGLRNPHLQTFFAVLSNWHREPDSAMELMQLSDGDKLSVFTTTPETWQPHLPTVILMHGLCGSHRSSYLIRLANHFLSFNMRIMRVNMRGCEFGKAKKSYHGGLSDDIFQVIKKVKETSPQSPLLLIGFSLSGNVVLKLAGEMGSEFCKYVEQIIAVCAPVDLEDSAYRIQEKQNRIYHRGFLNTLVYLVEQREFTYRPEKPLKSCKNLIEFDNLFTAPAWGFNDAFDYYSKSSSLNLIPQIKVPCKILISQDDPIVNPLPLQKLILPKNIELFISEYGGHMGFIGNPIKGNYFWMDQMIIHWIKPFAKGL